MYRLLNRMAEGDKCLEAIIEKEEGYPPVQKIYEWISEDTNESKELSDIFIRAQELWCRAQVRKTIEIADDESRDYIVDDKGIRRSDNTAVNRDRNRIMARHWAMVKLAPKIFGEKITQEVSGKDGGPIKYETAVDRPPQEDFNAWQARVTQQLKEEKENIH